MTDEGLGGRNLADNINPLRELVDLSAGELIEGSLAHSERGEVDFAHGSGDSVEGLSSIVSFERLGLR